MGAFSLSESSDLLIELAEIAKPAINNIVLAFVNSLFFCMSLGEFNRPIAIGLLIKWWKS